MCYKSTQRKVSSYLQQALFHKSQRNLQSWPPVKVDFGPAILAAAGIIYNWKVSQLFMEANQRA